MFAKRKVAATKSQLTSLERAAAAEIALLESKEKRASSIVADTQKSIQMMTIRAPRNGTIVYVTTWPGDKKKIGDTCWRMDAATEVPDLTRVRAHGDVYDAAADQGAATPRHRFLAMRRQGCGSTWVVLCGRLAGCAETDARGRKIVPR